MIVMPLSYVGTSGWVYDWNEGGDLRWYAESSGLNAVELNASFYRFPFPSQVLGWRKRGERLRWSVKVHRSITHLRKMGKGSEKIWEKFRRLFSPLDDIVDFYLFQLPPSFSCREEMMKKIEDFESSSKLGERMAVEFRSSSCFREELSSWGERLGITLVSVDSPEGTWIAKSSRSLYLRLHGRGEWYFYNYSREELVELIEKSISLKPEKIYIFFNNDHYMLENARLALEILKKYEW